MSYTYATFQQALATEMSSPQGVSDPNFVAILQTLVDYAEQRCYRELDLLHAETQQVFGPMTTGVRSQSYAVGGVGYSYPTPPGQILIINRVNILPSTYTPGTLPTSHSPCDVVSVDYLDAVFGGPFPNPDVTGLPYKFAVRDDLNILFGPAPDKAYFFHLSGEMRPQAIYNIAPQDGTQSSFLTTVLPDLFLAAAMVSASGYRKNFGAQSDDPRQAVSWETQYQTLLSSAQNEEMRKSFLGWQMMSSRKAPAPAAPGG